jgi:hypothetical protein
MAFFEHKYSIFFAAVKGSSVPRAFPVAKGGSGSGRLVLTRAGLARGPIAKLTAGNLAIAEYVRQ